MEDRTLASLSSVILHPQTAPVKWFRLNVNMQFIVMFRICILRLGVVGLKWAQKWGRGRGGREINSKKRVKNYKEMKQY